MGPERQLRVFQVVCVVFVAVCFIFTRTLFRQAEPANSFEQGLFVLLALWSAYSGFRLQQTVNRVRTSAHLPPDNRSTPIRRWRAGHLMRLASATSVGLWGMILNFVGSPTWLVGAMFGLGLILLLIWSPGSSPAIAES
jgi:hypothetical protein